MGLGQGEVAASATDAAAARGRAATATATEAVEAAVGLLRRSSLSNHLRGDHYFLSSNDG